MGSEAHFVAQFFPVILLGALSGKLMEDSGTVTAIVDFVRKRAMLAEAPAFCRLFRARPYGGRAVPRRRYPPQAGGDRACHIAF
jgi:hypothetical protein